MNYLYIEYQAQSEIRNSDKSIKTVAKSNYDDPLISSNTWREWGEGFETGKKAFESVAGLAGLAAARGSKEAGLVAAAAAGTAVMAGIAVDIAKVQENNARQQEKAAAEKRALEKAIRESVDRGMKEHNERIGRGEYRDPPTREQMDRIGRTA